jgi:hypothetical protein
MWAKKDPQVARSVHFKKTDRAPPRVRVSSRSEAHDAAVESAGDLACRPLLAQKIHTDFLNVRSVSAAENSN